MRYLSISILAACTLLFSCKKEYNSKEQENSKIKSDSKIGAYMEIDNLPGVSTLQFQTAAPVLGINGASKSCSCDGHCTSAARNYTISIYDKDNLYLEIILHKDRADKTTEFFQLNGKVPFFTYWFQDPINLGTPVVNGAEIVLYYNNEAYRMDAEMSNSKNNPGALLNNKIAGTYFEITKFDAGLIQGKFNLKLSNGKRTITLKNGEFKAQN